MAGRVLRVVPRIGTDFSKLNTGTERVYLARRIDVSQWREVTFYLRFHAGTSCALGVAANAQFIVYADGFTDEDPGALATATTDPAFLTQLIATNIGLVAVANTMVTVSVPANCGHLLTIALYVNQPAAPNAAAFVISVDMSGKE